MQFYSTGFSTQCVDAVINGEVNCKFDSAKFTLCVGDLPWLCVHGKQPWPGGSTRLTFEVRISSYIFTSLVLVCLGVFMLYSDILGRFLFCYHIV